MQPCSGLSLKGRDIVIDPVALYICLFIAIVGSSPRISKSSMINMHSHNPTIRKIDREFNSHFNSLFINKYSFICDAEDPVSLHGAEGVKKGFITYQTAWLSNIDRLMSMANACDVLFDSSKYRLIDLGGGKSISTYV